jgi:RNA polymerase sigma-70 factor (ECF subfamily)
LVGLLVDEARRQFIRLMTKYERMVYGYIFSLVPNWADADEILQETNIRLWEEFEKFQPGTNFAAWAVRVAHFQVLTWRKKVSRSKLVFDQRVVDALAAEPYWTDEIFEARQAALAECVAELSENSRELLKHCYVNGAKAKDVAAELNRKPAAIYKALERIRGALHSCIERRITRTVA